MSTPCTRRTCRPPRSPRQARACTTRSATCSAASTTCRTPRRTRPCSRTCWRSTGPPHRTPSGGSPRRLTALGLPEPNQEAQRRDSALDGLVALKQELNAPRALADYGFTEDSIAEAAEAILPSVPPSNPRPVTADGPPRAAPRRLVRRRPPRNVPEKVTKSIIPNEFRFLVYVRFSFYPDKPDWLFITIGRNG